MNQNPAIRKPRLLDQLRTRLRLKHYSWATEKAYVKWVERYLRFHKDRTQGEWIHPAQMGKAEVETFLSWLAVERTVAPSTQEQAFAAILFLYREVLAMPLAAGSGRLCPMVLSLMAQLAQRQCLIFRVL